MDISYGQFTGWVSVSYVVKSEPSCTSHKPRASYQRWLVQGDLKHEICPHAATQSYTYTFADIPFVRTFFPARGTYLNVELYGGVVVVST